MDKKTLKINKRLPQILLPKEKLQMFIDWWNSDIRFEKTVPHSFDEGYLIVENKQHLTPENFKDMIKVIAKAYKTTYRNIENQLKVFLDVMSKFTIYFKFTDENAMYIETYGNDDCIISSITFSIGETNIPEKEINLTDEERLKNCKTTDDILNIFNWNNLSLLITCLWYIATTTRSTKYIYEKKSPVIAKRHKKVVVISDTKTINTPIYDMRKIRVVKVENLQSRKKGWTYSHAFQVHGHYRHYKNGKTIFIDSFIKGKNKTFKSQQLILNPKEMKGGEE